jgi:hypothetical protein
VGKPGAPLTLVALTALAFTVAGCSGDDDGGGAGGEARVSPTAADETPTTENSREALEAEIIAAYEASWNDFIKAGNPPSPEAEFLVQHLSGEALETTRDLLRQYEAEGVVVRGTYEFDATVRDLGDDRAVVEDCGFDQLQLVIPSSGTVVETFDNQRDGLVAELTLEGSSWKVIGYADNAEVCGL